jgi:excisionase family DNA binding protein
LVHALTSVIGTNRPVSLSIEDRTITLPAELAAALVELLEDISEGRDVISAPAGLPLGTEVASDLLGVSRPGLTTLLDRGDIPSSRVGSKRRIRLGDLLTYRRSDDARRREGLTWEFLNQD